MPQMVCLIIACHKTHVCHVMPFLKACNVGWFTLWSIIDSMCVRAQEEEFPQLTGKPVSDKRPPPRGRLVGDGRRSAKKGGKRRAPPPRAISEESESAISNTDDSDDDATTVQQVIANKAAVSGTAAGKDICSMPAVPAVVTQDNGVLGGDNALKSGDVPIQQVKAFETTTTCVQSRIVAADFTFSESQASHLAIVNTICKL